MAARAALLAARPGAVAYARAMAAIPSPLAGTEGRVASLAVYPVKGLGALAIPRARVERRGLVDPTTGLADRGVLLAYREAGATPEGEYDAIGLSNRNEAALAVVSASFRDGSLVYEAPGRPSLHLSPSALLPAAGSEPVRVKLPYGGGPVLEGTLDEGPLASWVADLLRSRPARRRFDPAEVIAIRAPPTLRRTVADRHRAGEDADTLYGDGAHALVASASTLAWMNASLAEEGARAIAMEAFRPNVVVEGLPPNAEDLVAEAEIGGRVRVVLASLCVRCDATRVDAATGTRPDVQPLAWLARNRPPRGDTPNSATFAMNSVFPASAHGKLVAVGEAFRVLRER